MFKASFTGSQTSNTNVVLSPEIMTNSKVVYANGIIQFKTSGIFNIYAKAVVTNAVTSATLNLVSDKNILDTSTETVEAVTDIVTLPIIDTEKVINAVNGVYATVSLQFAGDLTVEDGTIIIEEVR